ncbi:hypothetical protein ACHAXM_003943, partial [Skeletonema potamos]
NGKYNGHTVHTTVNGVDTSDVNRKFTDKEFDDPDVRTYILNRRLFLKKNNSSYSNDRKIKEMVMEIAQTIMDKKRSGEDDSNPRDDKKQKGHQIILGKITTDDRHPQRRSSKRIKASHVEADDTD